MILSKEERYLLHAAGWAIAHDETGEEEPYIYMVEDYDGCHAEGERMVKHVIEGDRELLRKIYLKTNEKIEKLVWQVVESLEPVTDPKIGHLQWSVDFNTRLAELVVKECVRIGLEQKKWVEDQTAHNDTDVFWNRARIQQSQHIVDKIREHFGVEE